MGTKVISLETLCGTNVNNERINPIHSVTESVMDDNGKPTTKVIMQSYDLASAMQAYINRIL